jgi:hypothetical protein
MLQVAFAPVQARVQPPPQASMEQVLPSAQELTVQLPPAQPAMVHEDLLPMQSTEQSPSHSETVHLVPLQTVEQAPGHVRPQVVFSAQVVLHPPAGHARVQGWIVERHVRSHDFLGSGTTPAEQVQLAPVQAHDAFCDEGAVHAAGNPAPCPPDAVVPPVAVVPPADVPP